MTLRVLTLSTLYPNDQSPGFGIFVERLMQAVAARGDIEVEVWNPIGLPPFPLSLHPRYRALRDLPDREERGGVAVYRPRFRLLPGVGGRYNPPAIASALLPAIRRRHAEAPYDAIDAQFFWPDGPAAAHIAKALNLPLSIKARGSDIHYWGTVPAARRQILAAAEQASGLVAVSQALAKDMITLGMNARKIAVHYTGIDKALFHPRPRAEARAACADLVPVDGRLAISVGNLIPLKGHDLAIAALSKLPDLRLVIAGKGPEKANLRALAAKLGLSDRVVLAGSLAPERLAVLLAAADAMVLASEREGLANAWVEALASGTPAVITDVGGAREVVRDDTAGRIVARNTDAIAEALRDLLAHPPTQAQVAAHADGFSWQASAEHFAQHHRPLAQGD